MRRPTKMTPSNSADKPQVERFKEAARDVETDDDEKRFDKILPKIAKAPRRTPSKDDRAK